MKVQRIHLFHIFPFFVLFLSLSTPALTQQRFATPQDAVEALSQAIESEDPAALATLFGPEFTQAVSSGDPQADRVGVQRLGTLMQQRSELLERGPYKALLQVGADKWTFPLPVVMMTDGSWAFDAESGKAELLRRRIEKNEERAIKIALFYATAQNQYHSMTGFFAPKFLSSSGLKDGLYWETGADGITSPLEPLVSRAENLGYEKRGDVQPILSGYNFRVLTAQGEYAPGKTQSYFDKNGKMTKGFALVAYPSRYGVSGKTSFIVGREGIVYQRDLGERTEDFGKKLKQFDPDSSWNSIAGNTRKDSVRVISTSDGIYPFYNSTNNQ